MDKLLIISGPTATGKTDLAVKIAKKFNGEIISADSRQIYLGLDIGTGKDHPKNLKIHLTDLISPNQSFSVAQYQKLALQKISDIHSKNELPIIVGGTGQYIDSVINTDKSTYSIRPNILLRFFLNKLSTKNIVKIYQLLDKKSYDSLNNSEKHNPHRLIRKIEIKLNLFKKLSPTPANNFDIFHISLIAPKKFLYPRIDSRVQKRLDLGLLDEIKKILKKYSWSDPGLNTLAYKEFKDYFNQNKSLDTVIKEWQGDEHAYARRQITWFKKQKNIHFVDISESNFIDTILDLVRKWYNLS